MKRFINGFISILINFVIVLFILSLFLVTCIFIFCKLSNTEIQDTISYAKDFTSNSVALNLSYNKENIDLNIYSNNVLNPNNTSINVSNSNFYYNQLDNTAKLIYDELEDNINNLKKNNYTIDFSNKFNNLLNKNNGRTLLNGYFQDSLDAFFYDHPELFYIDLTKITLLIESTTLITNTTYNVSIRPIDENNYLYSHFNSEEEVNSAILKLENIKNNLISNISNNISDYDKCLIVHDTLVDSLEYNSSDTENAHNIYGALIERKVVCEGYAKAFKYILDSLNIECILVSGIGTNSLEESEAHMWNYVKLNNNWYAVDVTWDDPIIIGSTLSSNTIRHDYFCIGSNTFDDSHIPNPRISDNRNVIFFTNFII